MTHPGDEAPKKTTRRRWPRVLAALGAALLLAPVAFFAWLETSGGGRWLRGQIIAAANEEIEGRLEVDSVSFSRLLRLELRGVRLTAPGDAAPVVSIDDAVVELNVLALLGKRIALPEVTIGRPVLHLESKDGATNLARALQPRHPKPEEPSKPPRNDLVLKAPRIVIRDGVFTQDGSSPVALRGLTFDAEVAGPLDDLTLDARLGLMLEKPYALPLSASTRLNYRPDAVTIDALKVSTDRSAIILSGSVAPDLHRFSLALENAHVAPEDVTLFAPSVQLLGAIALNGRIERELTRATVTLQGRLPEGTVDLSASAQLEAGLVVGHTGELRLNGVALQRLMRGLPETLINATLAWHGTGLPPNGTVEATLDADESRYQKLAIDHAHLEGALLPDGRWRLSAGRVSAAQLRLTATGEGTRDSAELSIDLKADDLARTRALLNEGLSLELAPMQGRLRLSGRLSGPFAALRGRFTLDAPQLGFGETHLSGLSADLSLTRHEPLTASLTNGRLDAFSAGAMRGRHLAVSGGIDGRTLRLTLDGELAQVKDPQAAPRYLPVMLALSGSRDTGLPRGVERWTLDRIEAHALGLDLVSRAPAVYEQDAQGRRLSHGLFDGTLGPMQLEASQRRSGEVALLLTLRDLDVERLPKGLLPDATVAGHLTAELSAEGPPEAFDVRVRAGLTKGAFDGLQGLTAELEGTLHAGRVDATLDASLQSGGRARLAASLPAAAPNMSKGSEINVDLSVSQLPIELVHRLSPETPALEGSLDGQLRLGGTWERPRVELAASVGRFKGFGVDGLALVHHLVWADGKVDATLTTKRSPGLEATLAATFPLAADEVLAGRMPALKTVPVEASLSVTSLELGWLAHAGLIPADLSGRIAGRLAWSGPAATPHLSGTLLGTGLANASWNDLGFSLDLDANDHLAMHARATVGEQPFLSAKFQVGLPASRAAAMRSDEWMEAPLDVDVRLLPAPLSKLLPTPPAGAPPRPVETQLAGQLTVKGSAAAPTATLNLLADQIVLSGKPTGSFKLALASTREQTQMTASFLSRGAGTLQIDASMAGGLGLRTLDNDPLKQRTIDLSAKTEGFDLSLFDGLSEEVRDVAGRLDLALKAHGPLQAPRMTGNLHLTEARAALVGVGVFESVGLDLAVDGPRVTLSQLSGRSGAGRFSLTGQSDAAPEGGLRGELHAVLERLPLVQNYQTRGLLTLNADAPEITWKDGQLKVPRLILSKGLLQVPDRTQRSVQSLEPHPDIVFADRMATAPQRTPLDWTALVAIEIPDDFRIDAPLGNVLVLGASLSARLDDALDTDGKGPFDLSGSLRIPRGNLQLLQARFDIDPRSTVTLHPRLWMNPTLDVTARHESKGVEVTANITGTLQEMVRNFSSRPEMDESEILYFIATGQRQQRAQSDPFSVSRETLDDTLVGLVGSIGSSFAKSFLQRYIGSAADLDVLSLDTRGNAKVGTYLWNGRLYLGAQVRPNANTLVGENTAELDAEYRINDKTFGRLRVGDQNRSGLEILYQESLPAASQKKATKR